MMLSNLLKGPTYVWMLSLLGLAIFHLAGLLPPKWTSSFLCVAVVYYLMVHTKVFQRNEINEPPRISTITISRIFYAFRNRSTETFVMESLFGLCLWYPKEGMYAFSVATKSFLVMYDPKAVEFVLRSKTFLKKGFVYHVLKPLMKDGLILSAGKKWKSRRKLLAPAFRLEVLNGFFPAFNKHAKALVEKISAAMENQEVIDISQEISSCVLDIATETVLGKSVEAQESTCNKITVDMKKWSILAGKRAFSPWVWSDEVYKRTEAGKAASKCLDSSFRFVSKVISERKKHKMEQLKKTGSDDDTLQNNDTNCQCKQHFSLLDHLLDQHLKDGRFTEDSVEEEIHTFISAGHATTESTINWMLYMIGLHEDVQRNVLEEIDMVIGEDIDRAITAEDVEKLKYLNCVLKETLRLFPAVPVIARALDEDAIINGYKISKDTTIFIPIYMLHRNPEIFPNPEVFNPDRFYQPKSQNMHSLVYMPFSMGQRNCIGQKVAVYQALTVVAFVLRHFKVTAVLPRDKHNLSFNLILETENGNPLKFTRRNFFV